MVDLWSKVAGFGRFALDIRRTVEPTITLDDATRQIREGVAHRTERFLLMLARCVAGNPTSPYRTLLDAAGCDAGDMASLVQREGLEGALAHLCGAGVYVSYDEFKGRTPAVRGSQTLHFRPEDFDDPLLSGSPSATRSASGGAARDRCRRHRCPARLADPADRAAAGHRALDARGAPPQCSGPLPHRGRGDEPGRDARSRGRVRGARAVPLRAVRGQQPDADVYEPCRPGPHAVGARGLSRV